MLTGEHEQGVWKQTGLGVLLRFLQNTSSVCTGGSSEPLAPQRRRKSLIHCNCALRPISIVSVPPGSSRTSAQPWPREHVFLPKLWLAKPQPSRVTFQQENNIMVKFSQNEQLKQQHMLPFSRLRSLDFHRQFTLFLVKKTTLGPGFLPFPLVPLPPSPARASQMLTGTSTWASLPSGAR